MCFFCTAWRREGPIRELTIRDGYNVADNNLLACKAEHIDAVFEMLRKQSESIRFSGGFDAELMTERHVELLKSIRLHHAYFAADYPGALPNLERVSVLMADFHRNQKRCYVLIGESGESLSSAEKRLEKVYDLGFLPFAMLYRTDNSGTTGHTKEWRNLQRKWCRPAAFQAVMKAKAPTHDQ